MGRKPFVTTCQIRESLIHRQNGLLSVLLDTLRSAGRLGVDSFSERRIVIEGRLTMQGTSQGTGREATSSLTARRALYTPEQRRRRDATRWTLVQGILAPVQFLVFAVSVVLVTRALLTGEHTTAAHVSILVKTVLLYTIMVTGAIWEKVVFGQYLFAPAFFWEDVVSFLVIALHTIYLGGLLSGRLSTTALFIVALSSYAVYVVNAVQFLLKLRAARLQERDERVAMAEVAA
jgi:3-vinyl bacteriochlorophyllide hydratase